MTIDNTGKKAGALNQVLAYLLPRPRWDDLVLQVNSKNAGGPAMVGIKRSTLGQRRSRKQRATSATAFVTVAVAGVWAVTRISSEFTPAAANAAESTGVHPEALNSCPNSPLPNIGENGWDGPVIPASGHGLRRGLVSVTFDDGFRSTYDHGLPILEKYHIPSTQYVLSGVFTHPLYMTVDDIANLVRSGHEVASHTVDHLDLTTLSPAQVLAEFQQSRATLEALTRPAGQPQVCDFAYPYGANTPSVQDLAAATYSSARSVGPGFNGSGVNSFQIRTQNITTKTTPAQVQQWVDTAVQNKWWLVLVYHAVTPGAVTDAAEGRDYGITPANLDAEMSIVRDSGLTPLTMSAALAEVRSQ